MEKNLNNKDFEKLLKEQRKTFEFSRKTKANKTAIADSLNEKKLQTAFANSKPGNVEIKNKKNESSSDQPVIKQNFANTNFGSKNDFFDLNTKRTNEKSSFVDIREFKLKKRLEAAQQKIEDQKKAKELLAAEDEKKSALTSKLKELFASTKNTKKNAKTNGKKNEDNAQTKSKESSSNKKKLKLDPDIFGKRKHFED